MVQLWQRQQVRDRTVACSVVTISGYLVGQESFYGVGAKEQTRDCECMYSVRVLSKVASELYGGCLEGESVSACVHAGDA